VKTEAIEAAAQHVLVAGEHITSRGICWAAQAPSTKRFLLVSRRQYLLVLTDRRLLVFERRRGKPTASDLVIAKRYEAFSLERVSRSRPLMQVRLRTPNGNQLVFEFRPRHRELGGELVARLTPRSADPALDATADDITATPGLPS
jgi:hypothetical protein